ncbi:MAG: glutaredoxin family protein [archaeon]
MSYEDCVKNIIGKKKGDVFVFALSTCGWCMKTKELLRELEVEFCYVDVDLLNAKQKQEVRDEFEKNKLEFSFPKTRINGKFISGFKPDEIKKALKAKGK